MPNNQPKIIVTEDGTHTLYVEAINETYHSFHGAWQESTHVFINAGLNYLLTSTQPRRINLLEVGFGTGLNALLTALCVSGTNHTVNYHSLEPFPLDPALVANLNYRDFLNNKQEAELFESLHTCVWGKPVAVLERFFLHKHKVTLQDYHATGSFELIYFDAFAPSKQPELWTADMIRKVTGFLVSGGVLVTYCAKGQFKRDLGGLGLTVETLPGPGGKKEMVRALKK